MDFIKIIRSLEEFLYEVMSWIIFYPRTILRILLHPTRMTTYSEAEQDDLPSDRFTDALSPPLLPRPRVRDHPAACQLGRAAPGWH